jgi:hypothetical protein
MQNTLRAERDKLHQFEIYIPPVCLYLEDSDEPITFKWDMDRPNTTLGSEQHQVMKSL